MAELFHDIYFLENEGKIKEKLYKVNLKSYSLKDNFAKKYLKLYMDMYFILLKLCFKRL